MANYQQAPKLVFKGAKPKAGSGRVDWIIPQDIYAYIANILVKAKATSQLSLMIYLMGTKPGFACSTEHILENTGIGSKQTLSSVKKALRERGWIDYEEGKSITVDFDEIKRQMGQSQNDPKKQGQSENKQGHSQNDPQGKSQNDPQGQSENENRVSLRMTIINNIDNITDKETDKVIGKLSVPKGPATSPDEHQEARKVERTLGENELEALRKNEKIVEEDETMVKVEGVPKPGWYKKP